MKNKIIGLMVVIMAVMMGMGVVSATSLKITYINEDYAWWGQSGAYNGANGLYSRSVKLNPTESNFMSYLQNYDSVLFVGYGCSSCIGGNEDNGFSGRLMYSNEISSSQITNEVTLMTCYSYNNFGSTLINMGTNCVVGWPGLLTTNAFTEYLWAFHFYDCADFSTNSGYCENFASDWSGVSGSSSKGSCSNTHGTSKGSCSNTHGTSKGSCSNTHGTSKGSCSNTHGTSKG
ncbi:MAG: hypothetical protein DRP06_03230, partial [Candidatus Aenigmatarchaeota archaeon]